MRGAWVFINLITPARDLLAEEEGIMLCSQFCYFHVSALHSKPPWGNIISHWLNFCKCINLARQSSGLSSSTEKNKNHIKIMTSSQQWWAEWEWTIKKDEKRDGKGGVSKEGERRQAGKGNTELFILNGEKVQTFLLWDHGVWQFGRLKRPRQFYSTGLLNDWANRITLMKSETAKMREWKKRTPASEENNIKKLDYCSDCWRGKN